MAADSGAPGSTVSLLPFGGDADGVTTDGLVYPLADESLALGSARGVSNVIGVANDQIRVDLPVRVEFEIHEDSAIPKFRPI